MLENLLESLRIWHIMVGVFGLIFLTVICTATVFILTPKYMTYVESERMRRAVLWSETHEKMAYQIGPVLKTYPDFTKYMEVKNNQK